MLDLMPPFRFKYWIHDNSNHVNKQALTCTGWSRPEKQAADQYRYQSFHGPDGSTFKAISAGWMLVSGHWNSLDARHTATSFLRVSSASARPSCRLRWLRPLDESHWMLAGCGACDSTRRLYYQLMYDCSFIFIHSRSLSCCDPLRHVTTVPLCVAISPP